MSNIGSNIAVIDMASVFRAVFLSKPGDKQCPKCHLPRYIHAFTSLLNQINPDGLLILWDNDLLTNNNDNEDLFHKQMADVVDFLDSIPIKSGSVSRFVIAVQPYLRRLLDYNCRVMLVTGDPNARQLASSSVSAVIVEKDTDMKTYTGNDDSGQDPVIGFEFDTSIDIDLTDILLSNLRFTKKDQKFYQYIDSLATHPMKKYGKLSKEERSLYTESVYMFLVTLFFTSKMKGRPIYSSRVKAAAEMYIHEEYSLDDIVRIMDIESSDILKHLQISPRFSSKRMQNNDLYDDAQPLSNLKEKNYRRKMIAAPYDDGMMQKAIVLYNDPSNSFQHIYDETSISKVQLEKFIANRGLERIHRKTPIDRSHINASKVNDLIFSGRTINEASHILNMSINTVKKYMNEEARVYYLKTHKRSHVVQQLKSPDGSLSDSTDKKTLDKAMAMYFDNQSTFKQIQQATGVSSQSLKHYLSKHIIRKTKKNVKPGM